MNGCKKEDLAQVMRAVECNQALMRRVFKPCCQNAQLLGGEQSFYLLEENGPSLFQHVITVHFDLAGGNEQLLSAFLRR